MGKLFAFVGAGAISFIAFFQVGDALRGAATPGSEAAYSAHMEGCLRQVRPLISNEARSVKACECMYEKFAEKGYSLTDAFTSDFDDMSRITRGCAVKHGARLR